ncbi:MAG: PhoX family phosphatase [Actinomycetota bacterium]
MEEDDFVTNPTDNTPFAEVVQRRLSRREVLAGGAAAAAATFFVAGSPAEAFTGPPSGEFNRIDGAYGSTRKRRNRDRIDFEPVANADASGPEPAISPDYTYQVLIPWGTPIQPDGPSFSWPPTSAADAEQQVGIGHDGMWFFPIGRRNGLLCVNHEFGRNSHVLGKDAPESLEDVRISQAVHGVSVIKVRQDRHGNWEPVASRRNRRITPNTPVTFAGPVRKSELLRTKAGNPTQGTVNNCANGYTPWGTYLTCEENFNGYFGATDSSWTPNEAQERYGFSVDGFGYGWEDFDPRFDLANPDYANEENRFGWIVEIDPFRPGRKPVKRTALGRFKHEGIALTIGKGGRAVGYMGDDQRFDYIYKFVSDSNYRRMLRRGQSPLDHGKLYCARFNDDGSGNWLELTIENEALAARFSNQEEVLTYARLAADILGATPMDRPEWTSVGPNGDVYCTLTNNSQRTEPNAANPQAPNQDGHIIRWRDTKQHTGTEFKWDIIRFASDSTGTDHQFSDPDGLWVDPDGRIFIQTDGGQPDGQNNQMLVSNERGEIRRLFAGVTGDEITGVAVDAGRRSLFINSQHPGNGDPTVTNFPAPTDGVTVPRDTTIVLRRKDGGIVGS